VTTQEVPEAAAGTTSTDTVDTVDTDSTDRSGVAATRGLTGHPEGTGRLGRLWRGADDDPAWSRPALFATLLAAAICYAWALSTRIVFDPYYVAAVQSAKHSWKSFFFGSLDSADFMSIDKPPLTVWIQAVPAKIFGTHNWVILAPGILASLAATVVLHHLVRRSFGHVAALITAVLFAFTPVMVVMTRHNKPDAVLVLVLVLAAWAVSNAQRSGRWAPLIWAGVALGIGFNLKQVQALLVLPALALVYLAFAPGRSGRRVLQLLVAGGVLTAVGLAWVVVVDRVPKDDRPYMMGSTDNSAWQALVSSNGLERIRGGSSRGTLVGINPDAPAVRGSSNKPVDVTEITGGLTQIGDGGWRRLFIARAAGQASWLLPLSFLGLVVGLALWGRRRDRLDPERADLVLWGGWLLVHFYVLSFSNGLWNSYYTATMAPAIAVLAAVGVVGLVQLYRTSAQWAWLLPVSLAGSALWSFALLRRAPHFLPWLAPLLLVVASVAALALLVTRYAGAGGGRTGRVTAAAMAGLIVAVIAGPTAYGASTPSQPNSALTSLLPAGGPQGPEVLDTSNVIGAILQGLANNSVGTDPRMIGYIAQNRGDAKWLLATIGAVFTAPIMVGTGQPVMSMGGYTGSDPTPTPDELARYVSTGQLRFVMLMAGADQLGLPVPPGVVPWANTHCGMVSPAKWGAPVTPPSAATGPVLILYDCTTPPVAPGATK
jgi:4-amino-4-deoxy-L-arabinose transferase-like glycosyltransferase